jgi:DNA (cytosine-5)-methyltransferase 1
MLERPEDEPDAIQAGFLPPSSGKPPSLPELLSDLEDESFLQLQKIFNRKYLRDPKTDFQRALRTRMDGSLMAKGSELTEQEYSTHADYIRKKFQHMIDHGGEIPEEYKTKKFAQRVFPRKWGSSGPSITATSLPDDYVHYLEPRAPTVREWARLQTFPDWYVFKGPRTTGGRRRAGDPSIGDWSREVPKFTQIGNAVPVLLARKIGEHLAEILRKK